MRSSHRRPADLDWLRAGDHVCHFYGTADELGEVLIPYYKAGLESHESCLWIAGDPWGAERARSAMRMAVPDFDQRVAAGQMQIISHDEWYRTWGTWSAAEAVKGMLCWKDQALAKGYRGVRSGGNLSSLYEQSLDAFLNFERLANQAFEDQPIVALCNYCLTKFSGKAVLDAMQCHGFGLSNRRGRWMPVEVWHRNQLTTRVAHAPLLLRASREAELLQIVEELLGVYMLAYPGRLTLGGGRITLLPLPAAKLRRALHELASNALKFGALAVPGGTLAVKWHLAVNGSRRLRIVWTEHGMSQMTIPERVGYGTRTIAGAVENYVRSFDANGMQCTFELRL
ncbi:MAG: MEDS domain-containing protein [Hyphomicrobiaceae bacterium]|nr:MEDS domain-containing protein [Hyphomicrobiaceae bacterium]